MTIEEIENELILELRKNYQNQIDREIHFLTFGGIATDGKLTGLLNLGNDTN